MISNTAIEKAIKKFGNKLSLGSVITVLSVIGSGYAFYWRTITIQESHTEKIEVIEQKVTKIEANTNNTEVFKGVSKAEYEALKDKVVGIEKSVDKIDNKLDRILIQTK